MILKKFIRQILVICIVCLSAQMIFAQNNSPSLQMIAANELFRAQKWNEAAKAYQEVVKIEAKNANAWSQMAIAFFSLKQYDQAVSGFQKAIEISNNPAAMYNLACAYAHLNQKEKALEWLEKALSSNMAIRFTNFVTDSDLENLREAPVFKKLVEATERKTKPCMFSAEARQLDFWVGEWDVFNPQEQKVGTSIIERISVGCAVLENWSSIIGGGGKSLNFYDSQAGKWFQYWMGGNGVPLRYSGIFKDNAMRYEGEGTAPNGRKILNRLTFFNTNANTVRQLAESSADEGKTWQVNYDFKYVRKK